MARPKGQDELIRTVRKDWYYYKGDKLGKKERRWRLVFEYLDANGKAQTIKETFRLKTDADFQLDKLKIEHSKKGVAFGHRNLTFGNYAATYKVKLLAELETGKTECSKVDIMVGFFGFDTPIGKIRRVQVKEFQAHLQGLVSTQTKRPLEPRTIHTYLERLRAMLNDACEDELIESVPNIAGLIDRKLERKRTDKTITTAQLFSLLALCDEPIQGRFKDRKHLKLPLIASHELGCRVGELKSIKRSDILHIDHERKSGIVRIVNHKASRLTGKVMEKHVAISGWLYDEIMANGILELAPNTVVFMKYPNYKTAWNTLRGKANLGDIHWHDLRAVNATNRKFAGQDFEHLQEQIGHSKGSGITESNYIRPHWQQSMDAIKDYDSYMDFQRQRAEAVIETEAVN